MSLLSNLFPASAAIARAWCRPSHRTNCFAIQGGNACCICIPATATCFVIEMWGQGGGGAGACCCSGACTGGMGGDYAWITCSTTATVHTLCICACTCNCAALAQTGSPGQSATVVDCTVTNTWTVAAAACGGNVCCNGMLNMNSGVCTNTLTVNPFHSNIAINCCWWGFWSNNPANDAATVDFVTLGVNPFRQDKTLPFQQIQGSSSYINPTTSTPITCSCCTCFNFYVRGGCGWTDPAQWTTYNGNTVLNSYCGYGYGRGGTAYAGGAGQCCDGGGNTTPSYAGVTGNAPGGGGSSANASSGPGGCFLGSCGGLSLVLISWS